MLVLRNHCQQDAVIYSDDAGQTWHLSRTRLPDNGEAQLAEVGVDEVLFDGRSDKGSYERGVALSTDAGETFGAVRFADDASSGVSCLASLIALPLTPTTPKATLLFSHPAAKNRSGGVLLRSVDGAASWTKVGTATPDNPSANFGYSSLSLLPGHGQPQQHGWEGRDRATATAAATAATVSVGLTYETGGSSCTSSTSACRIMYRNLTVPTASGVVA